MSILVGDHSGEGYGAVEIRASHHSIEEKIKRALSDMGITKEQYSRTFTGCSVINIIYLFTISHA